MKRLAWIWAPLLVVLPLLAQRANFNRNPMEQVQKMLADADVPLSEQQQEALRTIMEEQRRAFRESRRRFRERREEGSGDRRGDFRRRGRFGEALQEKIRGVLTPEQLQVWDKYRAEQIRRRGGYPALRLLLQEVGFPLTENQELELQTAFRDYNRQRRELQRAGEGPADAAKLEELEKQHFSRIIQLLQAEQRRALIESRRKKQRPD